MGQVTAQAGANSVVIIPALNEERAIRAVVSGALQVCKQVIVIDDGSTDGTYQSIADLPVEVIRHPQPTGKAHALLEGFRRALDLGYDGVLTMDGDGQHAASDLPRLLAAAQRYPNHVIIGARLLGRDAQPNKNRFGNQQADWWVSLVSGQHVIDSQSGQRYYPRSVIELALKLPRDGFVFESEILIEAAWHGIWSVSVPIESRYADDRRASHFRPVRDVGLITRMVARRLFLDGGFLRAWRRPGMQPSIIVDAA